MQNFEKFIVEFVIKWFQNIEEHYKSVFKNLENPLMKKSSDSSMEDRNSK